MKEVADEIALVRKASQRAIEGFSGNRVFVNLKEGTWDEKQYHGLLLTLLYQVYQGTMSFAAAAANCPPRLTMLREFLVHHAHEEMPHYKWIIDDLNSTGYQGPDPLTLLPPPSTLAYVSFNINNAQHAPGSRLASSIVLEGIGQRFGGSFGRQVVEQTSLKPENLTFFLSHGETDKTHIVELWDIIEQTPLTPEEWRWMAHSSYVAGTFYKRMWDDSVSYLTESFATF
jgi:Iron-containing redox enzyme